MEMVEMCTDLLQDADQYKADLNVLTEVMLLTH